MNSNQPHPLNQGPTDKALVNQNSAANSLVYTLNSSLNLKPDANPPKVNPRNDVSSSSNNQNFTKNNSKFDSLSSNSNTNTTRLVGRGLQIGQGKLTNKPSSMLFNTPQLQNSPSLVPTQRFNTQQKPSGFPSSRIHHRPHPNGGSAFNQNYKTQSTGDQSKQYNPSHNSQQRPRYPQSLNAASRGSMQKNTSSLPGQSQRISSPILNKHRSLIGNKDFKSESSMSESFNDDSYASEKDVTRNKFGMSKDKKKITLSKTEAKITLKQKQDEYKIFKSEQRKEKNSEKAQLKEVIIPDAITVANLSDLLCIPLRKLIFRMEKMGITTLASDYILTSDIASSIALEFNIMPIESENIKDLLVLRPEPESWESYPHRPPVVTIMGHVDHGKTTLLDSLRKSSVAQNEAGGITQHIGAFSVKLPGGKMITFLDTPGHAAFSEMRKRGAQTTDIVILVVAADDGVMPQTIEAIKHAQAAKVPIIVAINKCDKPEANSRKIKENLTNYGLYVEDFGGEVPSVEISALTGKGLLELEETIIAVSEDVDFRGDPSGLVEGVVIESKLDKGKGNVATILIRRGTLKRGSILTCGSSWGKVRAMNDERGIALKEATPSMPVEVTGWKTLPSSGNIVIESSDENTAKKSVQVHLDRQSRLETIESITLLNKSRIQNKQDVLELSKPMAIKQDATAAYPTLNLIVKADVHGSLEAILGSLDGLPQHEVKIKVVSSKVGPVTDAEVDLAHTTKSTIISFNIKTEKKIKMNCDTQNCKLLEENIIYNLLDSVKELMADLLPLEEITHIRGEAEVLQIFEINVKGKETDVIAGCRVLSGKVQKDKIMRINRRGDTVWSGKIKTFKHVKKDITEATKGLECGISLEGYRDIAVGDTIQCIEILKSKRKLT